MSNNNLLFIREEDDGKVILLRHELQKETQRGELSFKQRFLQWFGVVTTVFAVAAALTPDTFRIPGSLRPWVFLGALFWYFIFAAGIFSS